MSQSRRDARSSPVSDRIASMIDESSQNDEVEDDDYTTSGSNIQSNGSTSGDDFSTDAIAKRENKAISLAKLVVLGFLATLAVVVSYIWFRKSTRNEESVYSTGFEDYASRLVQVFYETTSDKIVAATTLATSFTSATQAADWPFVTMTDFERRVGASRRLAGATSIWFSPVVLPQDLDQWHSYAVEQSSKQQQRQSQQEDAYQDLYLPFEQYSRATSSTSVGATGPASAQEDQFVVVADNDYSDDPLYRSVDWTIEQGLYRYDNATKMAVADDPTSYSYLAPVWQASPRSLTSSLPLWNQLSDPSRQRAWQAMAQRQSSVFTSSISSKSFGPHVSLYTPIFDSNTNNTRKVVAGMTFDLDWATFFYQRLQGIPGPVYVVVENTCEQSYTYLVDDNSITYLSEGDDNVYNNKLELSYESSLLYFDELLGTLETEQSADNNVCSYNIVVYPSEEFESEFLTTKPKFAAIGVGGIFVLTAAVFLMYDLVIERRQARVMRSANRSNAIVKSLFPAGFRDRLMEEGKKGNNIADLLPENYLPMETPKLRLKTYLTDSPASGTNNMNGVRGAGNGTGAGSAALSSSLGAGSVATNVDGAAGLLSSEPIADFFPHTTVLFADIAGFTAWSSSREPSQVFTLLETLYGAMDKAARKLGVFKVETVGDCYVAATGLPDPRDDHAILMTRFANTCLLRINELTKALEAALGPGTGDLAMRFGIHSGPVTAGVLRGEKSRFQLFGDTMNTAARMESTGLPKRVHMSKQTADLLIAAGKSQWVQPRNEVVTAKGKGKLQTFWLLPGAGCSSHVRNSFGITNTTIMEGSSSNDPDDDQADDDENDTGASTDDETSDNAGGTGTTPEEFAKRISVAHSGSLKGSTRTNKKRRTTAHNIDWDESDTSRRFDRLVDWNVDVLIGLLKRIVARRNVVKQKKSDKGIDFSQKSESSYRGKIALDEVKEVMELPTFNAEAAIRMATDANSVELPEGVRTELHDYMRRIAASYNDNPFHNFEHASHVALSANKLLKRIVMPDDIDYRRDSKEEEIEKVKAVALDLHNHTYGISSDPVTQFAAVFCALIHDAGHTGVPNGQLAKEDPDTAAKYRNQSIAEQRSVDLAWDILMEPKYKNLRSCMFPAEFEWKHFRQLIVNSVLATDIFDKELSALRKARWQKAFYSKENFEDEQMATNRKATIVIEHIIQASDVAHTMQHWHIYKKWNERLFQEMYAAYIDGRSEKDPSEGWYKGELWFYDNYVIPLAHKLKECGVFGVSSAEYLNYALENRDEWERKGQEVVAEMTEKAKKLGGDRN